jgi:predicted RNA-binding Zn ribbon-like protein
MVPRTREAAVAWDIIDGLRIPLPVAGVAALDFLNTRAGWPDQTNEYLVGYPPLAVWARERGLVDAAACRRALTSARREPTAAALVLDRALTLREALRPVVVAGQATPAAARDGWPVLRAEVRAARGAVELAPDPDAAGLAVWRVTGRTEPLLVPYIELVLAVSQLLVSPEARSVRACPMPDCGWVFADPSGRRRWCSMAWCGNRSKVRAHAARARAALAKPTGR